MVLGTPIGYPYFISPWAESRMRTENELLSELPRLPDLQCAWLLLAMCASPRANHALRTVPPLDIAAYAQAHDAACGRPSGPALAESRLARRTAHGPWRLSRHRLAVGLTSAVRTAPAAYWAAWADALPVVGERAPALTEACVRQLGAGRLRPAAAAPRLRAEGWQVCPSWRTIADGARPPPVTDRGMGDWLHG